MVRALDLRLERSRVRISTVPLSGNNLGQVVHVREPVTKQYNLVPVKGRWCPAAGKVTVGLASHRPCVTDFSGLSTYALTAQGREMSTPPTLLMGMALLYLILCPDDLPLPQHKSIEHQPKHQMLHRQVYVISHNRTTPSHHPIINYSTSV